VTDDDLVYNFDGIDTVAMSIDAFVSQMYDHLAEVDTAVLDLLADGWTGITADAFDEQSRAWHQSAEDMAKTLHELGKRVGDASVNMQLADNRASARFAEG